MLFAAGAGGRMDNNFIFKVKFIFLLSLNKNSLVSKYTFLMIIMFTSSGVFAL